MSEPWDHTKLAPGDPMAYTWSPNPGVEPIVLRSTVSKTTKVFIVAANGAKFYRANGRAVAKGRGWLVDPEGKLAQQFFWWQQYWWAMEGIDRIDPPAKPVTREGVEAWLDKVAAVVEESRALLREIGGGLDA